MVVAIAAVELIISLTPVTAPGDVIARRVILWTALGTVIAFAAHELRTASTDPVRRRPGCRPVSPSSRC